MPYREKAIVKKYWTAPEVGEILKLSAPTVRSWNKIFKVTNRASGRYAKFNKEEIFKLRVIWFLLKVEKYTISGAKRQLIINKSRWMKEVKFNFLKAA